MTDKCEVSTLVPLFNIDKKHANDDKENTKDSKKGGEFGGVWGLGLFHSAS